jgi:hypothetical protein
MLFVVLWAFGEALRRNLILSPKRPSTIRGNSRQPPLRPPAAAETSQVECEHQLSIERDRCAEAGRQRAAAEERVVAAEARAAALEAAFADFR